MTTTKTYLPLVPASHGVVLPGMVVTLNFETPESLAALAELGMPELAHGDLGRGELGLAGTRSTTDTSTSLPSEVAAEPEVHHDIVIVPRLEHGFATVGTIARVEQVGFMPGGGIAAVVRGIERAHIGAGATTPSGALTVHVDPIAVEPTNPITELLATEYRNTAQRLLDAIGGRAVAGILNEATDPSMLADTIAWLPSLTFEQRVELLETIDVAQRLTLALKWVRTALAEAEVTRDVDTQVHDHFEQQQREAILRKRRDAINKELGEGGSSGSTPDYRERLSSLEPVVAVATYEAIEKEINRLDQLGEQSMESGWIRTWLDTVFEIPFAEFTKDNLDLTHARSILDADHTGLKEPKDRIIEIGRAHV